MTYEELQKRNEKLTTKEDEIKRYLNELYNFSTAIIEEIDEKILKKITSGKNYLESISICMITKKGKDYFSVTLWPEEGKEYIFFVPAKINFPKWKCTELVEIDLLKEVVLIETEHFEEITDVQLKKVFKDYLLLCKKRIGAETTFEIKESFFNEQKDPQ